MENIKSDDFWVLEAIEEAKKAMDEEELPIAAILVSGDAELSRSQTQTKRMKSMTAHGELLALLDAGEKVFTSPRPLVIYTTLEPCLMCIGAAMQCQVDKIVYAMPAMPDGGSRFVDDILAKGQKPPEIVGGVLRDEAIELMRQFVKENPQHFGIGYAKALLDGVDKNIDQAI